MTRFLPLSALLLLGACASVHAAPTLDVAERLNWDAPPVIRASGLAPGTAHTLVLERASTWSADTLMRSETAYTATARGRIDTSEQVADGDDELSPYVPIRTMDYLQDTKPDGLIPGYLRITLRDEAGETLDTRTVGIGPDMDALDETPLGEAFPGAFVLVQADRDGPRPAVVYIGGSEGGDGSARATGPLLAAQGFTVLGLPYHAPSWRVEPGRFGDLPTDFAELPIDYLEKAVAALRERPDVDPDRVMLFGVSKGGEYALLAGSLIPDASPGGGFCGIVANVPSDVVWEGWGRRGDTRYASFSWRGEGLPFVPYANIARGIDPNDPYTLGQSHADGRAANPDSVAPARIAVERIDEPVLVTGGDKDTVWPSGAMARNVKAARDAAGLETLAFVYPEGGHAVSGTPLRRGTEADTQARLESFPATMAFLERAATRPDCRDAR